MASKKLQTRIGISGWNYPPWRGTFFPKGLVQKRELEFASQQFNSIEVNGTFYSLQRPESFQRWFNSTPDDFVFSIKAPRYITHIKRLNEIHPPLANFFASGVLSLGKKLGPILWQFPPSMKFKPDVFERFLRQLPRTMNEAARLAEQHETWMDKRSFTEPLIRGPIRHAVEIRNPSFEVPEFIDLLREYKVAFVFADTAGQFPYAEDLTSDFVYIRLHGKGELYVGGYNTRSLKKWAGKLIQWQAGKQLEDATCIGKPKTDRKLKDAYVYFDNDVKVRAPFDALSLSEILRDSSIPLFPLVKPSRKMAA